MKKYQKASMEVVEINNTDIVTASGETQSSTYTGSAPSFPGHGGDGNGSACN